MEYERVVSLDLTDLVPQVAVPPRPDLVTIVPASQEVYRAAAREGVRSPATVAASALAGEITDPRAFARELADGRAVS